MSEFSQSMFLGENTLDRIEKQATRKHDPNSTPPPSTSGGTSRRTTRSSQAAAAVKRHSSDEQAGTLEVIEESPTNNSTRFGGNVSRQKSVRERLKTIGTQSRSSRSRKGLRRNKSDSVVSKVGGGEGLEKSKARSESRDQLDMIDSELLKSDVCFNGLSGLPRETGVTEAGAQKTEINISKLLESDLSFDVPVRINEVSVA